MSLTDSLLVIVLAIIVPIASYVSFNRLLRFNDNHPPTGNDPEVPTPS